MDTFIKVAGTTYHPVPTEIGIAITEEFIENNVPCASTDAVLVPEPENPYDPDAVKVLIPLRDGSAFHIGYLPKAEPLKTKVKKITAAKMKIRDFRQMGDYNISFILTFINFK